MVLQEVKTFKINTLRKIAEQYASETRTSDDIFKENITRILEAEIRYQIKNGEIVIIEVKGKPRTGKSTVAIYIAKDWIDDELKKCGKKDKKKKFDMSNIARDDQEYSVLMSNPELMNDVILTDEQNELEQGGENASTEQQLKDVYSDVQAGRYIHRVSCSPEKEIDGNSDILLETVGFDRDKMITHTRVYYRINNAQNKYWQPIGYANICVKELIDNWEKNVKDKFLKTTKKKEEEVFVKEQAENDFYVEYMICKYRKMDLLLKENVARPRELKYAEAMLNVINRFKGLMKVLPLDEKVIKNYVEIEFRKIGIKAFSIVGIKLTTDRVCGVLNLYRSYWRTEGKKAKILKELGEKGEQSERRKMIEEEYNKLMAELKDAIITQEDELKRYTKLNKDYNKHLERENGNKQREKR